MTDDELHERLAQLGSTDGPAPDPAFANRLETDLRLTGLRDDLATARPWWQPVIMASVVVVLVVAGFAALRDRGQETEVVMTAADETRIVLSDGTELEGVEGVELPDGTRIIVGPDGSATVGGVVLGGGTESVVVDGHIEIVSTGDENLGEGPDPANSGPAGSRPSTTASRSATTSREVTTSTFRGATTSSAPATSNAPATSTTAAPTAPSTATTASERTDRQPSTTVTDGELEVELMATPEGDDVVRLSWTSAAVPELVGWRVMATAGDRTTVVLVIRDAETREVTLERLERRVSYRLVAVDSGGEVLAESNLAGL